MKMVRHAVTLEERFWPKVDKEGPVPGCRPDLGSCWIWTASLDIKGYGKIYVGTGRSNARIRGAHTVSYELCVGKIPENLELDHLCRVRSCVNPAHLEPVTHRENMLRGTSVSSVAASKMECPQSHPYDEVNTRWYRGTRRCKECDRIRQKEIRRIRREQENSG